MDFSGFVLLSLQRTLLFIVNGCMALIFSSLFLVFWSLVLENTAIYSMCSLWHKTSFFSIIFVSKCSVSVFDALVAFLQCAWNYFNIHTKVIMFNIYFSVKEDLGSHLYYLEFARLE